MPLALEEEGSKTKRTGQISKIGLMRFFFVLLPILLIFILKCGLFILTSFLKISVSDLHLDLNELTNTLAAFANIITLIYNSKKKNRKKLIASIIQHCKQTGERQREKSY